jgi:hypothetical protein
MRTLSARVSGFTRLLLTSLQWCPVRSLSQGAVLGLFGVSLTIFAGIAGAQGGIFAGTGDMVTARGEHTATLLNNGQVFITGGTGSASSGLFGLTSAELYDPATGIFTATGNMISGRFFHSATLLNNGQVLIAGGVSAPGGANMASAELYDPATGMFTATGNMVSARSEHAAVLLNNGKVLITGGSISASSGLASAELYDPVTGTFAATGSMTTARWAHTVTRLSNGLVLVAGGFNSAGTDGLADTELYDPVTGTFAATGSLTNARRSHTATLLNNGKVLIAGGSNRASGFLASAELYDPATGTCTATGSMSSARETHTATLLTNGQLLVAGGANGPNALATAELYDPATETFALTASMDIDGTKMRNGARFFQTATLLTNGRVLVEGGYTSSAGTLLPFPSAELYLPVFAVVISPTSLSFPNQLAGTSSASETVMLTNNESAALNITSIAINGANASDFAETNNCLGSMLMGASCSINVTFSPSTGNTRTGSLTITDNAPGGTQTVMLTGTGQDFSLVASGSGATATVKAGQTATYIISVAPGGGFDQSVTLTCSGAPAKSTCSVSPSTISLNSTPATTATVSVNTMAASQTLPPSGFEGRRITYRPIPFALALAAMFIIIAAYLRRKDQRLRWMAVLAFGMLVCIGLTMTSCGGGSSGGSGGGGGGSTGTPVGSYTISVSATATSGSTTVTHNTQLTLVVQ